MSDEFKVIESDFSIDEAMVILQQDTAFGSGVKYYTVQEVCDLLNSKNHTIQALKDMCKAKIREVKEWEEVYNFTKEICKGAGIELATTLDGSLFVNKEEQMFTLHSLLADNERLRDRIQDLEVELLKYKCGFH